ncbi:L-seryl-tRNA(Sec) selenium transferase [Peptococcaceae bacterium 1198_IL3148]
MVKENQASLLRALPAVDEILRQQPVIELLSANPKTEVVEVIRKVLADIRQGILADNITSVSVNLIVQSVLEVVKNLAIPNLRPVINGTGVVLHTNLGRAILSQSAQQNMAEIIKGYCNLEFNLDTGKRGSRYNAVEGLLTKLTGAEAALVVNNNASAVLLALGALAKGREVIVSRGQLVEIGGSFRIPEVMEQSNAKLVEVGATNKTYPKDYEKAITEQTGLLLNVHTSNYRIVGFSRETTVEELVELGQRHNLPVMSDLGSGFLVDLARFGLPKEPTVQEVVKAGADVVTFSGDKLLGGPQAGIIVGKKHYIEKMKKNPLTRAVRIDKFTVAALEATLREYLDAEKVLVNIPTLRMLTESKESLQQRAKMLANALADPLGAYADVTFEEGFSQVGGGAMPTADMPTGMVAIKPRQITVDQLVHKLRFGTPPVVGRVQADRLLLDVRTLQQHDTAPLLTTLLQVLASEGSEI